MNHKEITANGDSILMLHPASDNNALQNEVSPTAANSNSSKSADIPMKSSEYLRKEATNSCRTLTGMASNENKKVLTDRAMNPGKNICLE